MASRTKHHYFQVIRPGEAIYQEYLQPGMTSQAMTGFTLSASYSSRPHQRIPHPTHLVRGQVAKTLTEEPPTLADLDELWEMKQQQQLAKTLHEFHKLKGMPRLGDKLSAEEFSDWSSALLRYFRHSFVTNPALQSMLAIELFDGKANKWWLAHTEQ